MQRNRKLEGILKAKKASQKRSPGNVFIVEDLVLSHCEPTTTEGSIGNTSMTAMMSSFNSLAVASMNVPPCAPSDGEDDIGRKSFESWKELLEASLALVGISDEAAKMNAFKVKAGAKLLDILEEAPAPSSDPSAPYSAAMGRLKAFFGSREYSLTQRQKLRNLVQVTNEEDSKYVKRVVAAAKLCDYEGDKLLESVAEVIQQHATDSKVRETARKVLRKGGSLTDLVDRIRGHELDKSSEELYAKSHPPAREATVAAVSYGQQRGNWPQRNSFRGGYYKPMRSMDRSFDPQGRKRNWQDSYPTGQNTKPEKPCWRCSSNNHVPSRCFALLQNKVCHNCGVVGHIERACTKFPSPASSKRRSLNDGEDRTVKVAAVTKECCEDAEDAVAVIAQVSGAKEYLDLSGNEGTVLGHINSVPILFLIDSGAEVNTVNESIFSLLMDDEHSREHIFSVTSGSDKSLYAYASAEEVHVENTFVAELFISEDRPRLFEKFYVVRKAKPLLSRDTALRYSVLQLGLKVEIRAISISNEFPKFKMPPVVIEYHKEMPPSRNIYTNIPLPFQALLREGSP
ncbi:uncharacterized protein LOC126577811 [Anopheles aquasalis]|uniref:uncharacterized protein LOC126577811 n=1 Tax=Anopheles aquasalis TaxID=42839 RepID=UPI00215B12FE|nr:uncharacterized protein LOC126577811 [Anopheles aquasalis]